MRKPVRFPVKEDVVPVGRIASPPARDSHFPNVDSDTVFKTLFQASARPGNRALKGHFLSACLQASAAATFRATAEASRATEAGREKAPCREAALR
jgi:hypothetical protein